MNEVIKQSIEILFKNRMLRVVVSKHFVERLVDRKIELSLLSSALNRIADNVCLIAYTAQLVGDKVNVKFGGYHFIVNFKEMFCLDGKYSSITPDDIERRNAIALLLEEWGLLKVMKKPSVDPHSAIAKIKIIPFREKAEWILESKYTIGKK